MFIRKLGVIVGMLALPAMCLAEPQAAVQAARDSLQVARKDSIRAARKAQKDSLPKDNFFTRLIHGQIDHTFDKKIDHSEVAYPAYSNEGFFGLGAMGSLLFRLDRNDSLMQASDASILALAMLRGFFHVGVDGNIFFPGRQHRLHYEISYWRERPEFWGIDYASCAVRKPIKITRNEIALNAAYDYQFAQNFYVGAAVDFAYKVIDEIADKTYLNGQKTSYITTGVGASVQYDSRDHVGNPTRGGDVILRGMVYPSFLGTNTQTVCRITFQANYYQKLWKGAVLAFDAYTQINTPDAPWSLREVSGGKFRLRGYYEGRYIDNNLLSVQAELRQKLFWRLGLAAFGGFGALFPSFEALRAEHLLYTAGAGLRLEFKHNVNLRVDYGIGRRDPVSKRFTGAFVVTLNEAF